MFISKDHDHIFCSSFYRTHYFRSGVGRTGCFIALDLCVDEGNEDHSVDVSQCVTKLREQRVNMVQSLVRIHVLKCVYVKLHRICCIFSPDLNV